MRGIHLASLRKTMRRLRQRHVVDQPAVLEQNTPQTLTGSRCGYSTWRQLARSSWLRAEDVLAERLRTCVAFSRLELACIRINFQHRLRYDRARHPEILASNGTPTLSASSLHVQILLNYAQDDLNFMSSMCL
jgi:hypothetical protein